MFYRHNKTFWYQFCNFKHFLKAENSEDSLASLCVEFYIGLSCNSVWDWVTIGTSQLLPRTVSLPCLLPDEVIDLTDSLFIAQRKSRDILQSRKYRGRYSAHCNCSTCMIDGRKNATKVVSLEKFDMILLFFQSGISMHHLFGITCRYMPWNIFCWHRHDFLMSTTCQHNCMSMTALEITLMRMDTETGWRSQNLHHLYPRTNIIRVWGSNWGFSGFSHDQNFCDLPGACKRTFKTHPKHVLAKYENRP